MVFRKFTGIFPVVGGVRVVLEGETRFLERKHETLRVSGKELYTAAASARLGYTAVRAFHSFCRLTYRPHKRKARTAAAKECGC